MLQDNERSKSRNDKSQVSPSDSKDNQVNPGEDLMRSEENGASERLNPKETPDHKGETQNVKEDEGKQS